MKLVMVSETRNMLICQNNKKKIIGENNLTSSNMRYLNTKSCIKVVFTDLKNFEKKM